MANGNELTIEVPDGVPMIVANSAGKLTLKFTDAQGVAFSLNGEPQVLSPANDHAPQAEAAPAAAPNIITDSKTATALKQLHDVGEAVDGKGIYGHTVQLPTKFNVQLPEAYLWIAPQDLKAVTSELLTYKDSLPAIANLQNFHGRNGIDLKDRPRDARNKPYEQALYKYFRALASGDASVQEGWTLGTKEIVHGKKVGESAITVANNLYSLRSKMPEGSKFVTRSGSGNAQWQWSCTENPDNPSVVCVVDFTDGCDVWDRKDLYRLSARPVSLAFQP